MGLFLALSGVIGASSPDVQDATANFAAARTGGFELAQGSTDNPNIGVITTSGPNTTVMYPEGFVEWDDASASISRTLSKPVFSLHIHDEDLWMYRLFRDGEEIDWFNPIPDYWHELQPGERAKWKGNPALVASVVPGADVDAISKYLVEWNRDEDEPGKACPNDEFEYRDCWQVCDFMNKLGLEYPMGDDGSMLGATFRLWTDSFPLPSAKPAPSDKKPWWKRW